MSKLREKFILNEDEDKMEVIPAAELSQEPLPLDELEFHLDGLTNEEPVSEEIKTNAFIGMVNSAIGAEWLSIEDLNGMVATILSDKPKQGADAAIEIIKQLVEEKTAHVGMLQKVLELLDENTAELVKGGEDKAEEIVLDAAVEDGEFEELQLLSDEEKLLKKEMLEAIRGKVKQKTLKEADGDEDNLDYWAEHALAELDYFLEEKEYYEEDYPVLYTLDRDEIVGIAEDVGRRLQSNDYLWETVSEVTHDAISYALRDFEKEYITGTNSLTDIITPENSDEEVDIEEVE